MRKTKATDLFIGDEKRPQAFIDIETTGLDPNKHEIWEIACLLRMPDGKEETCSYFLDLHHQETASSEALILSGFHDRYPAGNSIPIDTAFELFKNFTKNAAIFGLNPCFDIGFLRATAIREKIIFQPEWFYTIVDIKSFAAGALGISPLISSNKLAERLGVRTERADRHSALGDCYYSAEIYDAARSVHKK